MSSYYPKASPVGGVLIRKVISEFKKNGFMLPLAKPILIAVSGGVDSMVLAHLLARYGRKVVDPKKITLLHLDHGWRKESRTIEKAGVKKLAQSLGVQFLHRQLKPPSSSKSKSNNWEEDARLKRLEVFRSLSGVNKKYEYVLTAHHEKDVVETLLFRFFRGEIDERGLGILFQDSNVLRPLLKVSKEEIEAYAKAEGIDYFEDPSNQDVTHFRSWCRKVLIPTVQEHFPGVLGTLARYVEREKKQETLQSEGMSSLIEELIQKPLNRIQRETISKMLMQGASQQLTLSGKIQLKRLKNGFMIEFLDRGNSPE